MSCTVDSAAYDLTEKVSVISKLSETCLFRFSRYRHPSSPWSIVDLVVIARPHLRCLWLQSLRWSRQEREVCCCFVELVAHRGIQLRVHRRLRCHGQCRVHRRRYRLQTLRSVVSTVRGTCFSGKKAFDHPHPVDRFG